VAGDAVENTDGELHGDEAEETSIVDGATAVAEDERPGKDGAEEADGCNGWVVSVAGRARQMRNGKPTKEADAHGERVFCWEAGELEEVNRVADQADAAQHLRAVDTNRDFGSSTIDALKAVPISAAHFQLLFEAVGLDDSHEVLLYIYLGRGKPAQNHLCLGEAALADEPPWALWDEEEAGDDHDAPEPLQMVSRAIIPNAPTPEDMPA